MKEMNVISESQSSVVIRADRSSVISNIVITDGKIQYSPTKHKSWFFRAWKYLKNFYKGK